MNIFNVDFKKLLYNLLPSFLRNNKGIKMFLNAIATAFERLLFLFKNNRNANLYNLQITPQICYLEKALNDRFDAVLRRIYITDGELLEAIYVYQNAELLPKYIYENSENEAILPLFFQGESGGFVGGISFIIHVPAELNLNFNEVKNFINQYKLVGKTCEIVSF
jgi:hypothetical protein